MKQKILNKIMKFINIMKQATTPSRAKILLEKISKKIRRNTLASKSSKTKEIIRENKVDWEKYCKSTNKKIYKESKKFEAKLKNKSKKKLSKLDVNMGGGGNYVFLYFLTRLVEPSCVVETGVAAGFSSSAFLEAMDKNGKGHLYSSDFPYFRLDNPERYIGILVEDKIKKRWSLFVEGDKNNIPKISKKIDRIDILHYDSDKSYEGREYVFQALKDKMHEKSVIIYDDIEDNNHFYYINKRLNSKCLVFEFENKHVGVVGDIR